MSEVNLPAGVGQKNSVEIFINALEKAAKSARVYAHASGQGMLENIFENVVNTLDRAFLDEDEIDVHVKPTQLVFERKVIYENKDKKHSLAYKLYENGIRLMTFKRGLPKDELTSIIKTLGSDFSSPELQDQDLYCAFIEASFDHFEVVGSDVLGEAQKEDPDLKEELSKFRKKIRTKTRDPSEPSLRKIRQDDVKVLEEFRLNSAQFAKSDEEVAKIVKTISPSNQGSRREKETLERLVLMGFHFLLQEGDVEQTQVGRELVTQISLMMIESDFLDLFGSVIKKVIQLQKDRSHQRGEYAKVLDSIYSVDNLQIFKDLLSDKEKQKKAAELLLLAPPSGVKLIILLLGEAAWCPKVFGEFVLAHSPAYAKWMHESVVAQPELSCWEALVNILTTKPNQLFAPFMTAVLSARGAGVNVKILRQCATIGSDEALNVFRPMLRSEEEEDRRLAYEILPLAKNKTALLMIKSSIEHKDFQSREDEEKVLAMISLLRLAGEAGFKWFEIEWMKPGEGFFKSKQQNERRSLLIKAAARTQPGFLEQILEQTPLESLSKDVQELLVKNLEAWKNSGDQKDGRS